MGNALVYGVHAVHALLANPHRQVNKLYVHKDKIDNKFKVLLDQVAKKNICVEPLTTQQMNQRFPDCIHQGIVALTGALPDYNESYLQSLLDSCKKPGLILILDGITDPHNLGACLRCADATGVHFVMVPKDKSACITPVVSKVATGAAESVPLVRVTNLVRSIEFLKAQGVWLYGACGRAVCTVYDMDCTRTIAIVLGAEGTGLRRLTRDHCDDLFSIPMLGSVESLNVSVATAVSLYEVIRQRMSFIKTQIK